MLLGEHLSKRLQGKENLGRRVMENEQSSDELEDGSDVINGSLQEAEEDEETED
jgi:hypothetical protein